MRPRVRLSAGHRRRPDGVRLPAELDAADRPPLLLLRPAGHRVQHRRRPHRVAGRYVRRRAVRTAPGRLPDALLPGHVQHPDVLRGHQSSAVERHRPRNVRRVPSPRPPSRRHAGRPDGHGPGDRHGFLRARQPGRGRLLEPETARPTVGRHVSRGGAGPGDARVPGRPQGGLRFQSVGAQRQDAPAPVPGAQL